MPSLWKQPLVHFLLAGLALFAVYHALHRSAAPGAGPIVVDREALLGYMQRQAQASDPAPFERALDRMSATNLNQLIQACIRDEVLYHEALRRGLDRNDADIRRRLTQKAEMAAAAETESRVQLSGEDIKRYYEQHRADYYDPPRYTFSYVFFDDRLHGRDGALKLAEEKREELNAGHVPAAAGPGYGDPYPREVVCGRRTADYIAAHFGRELADALSQLTPDPTRWYGPYASRLGANLVMLIAREEGRTPPLEEIERWVRSDARRARALDLKEEAIRKLETGYDVRVAYPKDGS